MERIRVVRGAARGPTALAAYDAALAVANVHDYNLVHVSSVIPKGVAIERVGTAPDLGPVGGRLTVVEARATVESKPAQGANGTHEACAGLGWARAADGRGVFYEAAGTDPETVQGAIDDGLRAGCALREWSPVDRDRAIVSTDRTGDSRATSTDFPPARTDGAPGSPTGSGDAVGPGPGSAERDVRYTTAVVLAVYGESEPIL